MQVLGTCGGSSILPTSTNNLGSMPKWRRHLTFNQIQVSSTLTEPTMRIYIRPYSGIRQLAGEMVLSHSIFVRVEVPEQNAIVRIGSGLAF